MNFADIGQVPYKHLPTDVLLSMRDMVCKELGRRGAVGDYSAQVKVRRGGGQFGRPATPVAKNFKHCLREMDALMAEDWSHLFQSARCDERRFYVYAHINPRKAAIKKRGDFQLFMQGTPFYIGKGCGRRAWDLNRNEGHGVELMQLRRHGIADSEIVCMIRENLTEREAFEIESKLIYFFGTKFEHGGKGILVNLDFPPRPY